MQDGRDIVYSLIGFGAGICAFFYGFTQLRRIRLIQNTPTSTVRGLAMGQVELEGVVRPVSVLSSPLTNTQCAAYAFSVEEYRRSGKSGSWVTVALGNSFYCPFYLEDATGKIKVYPAGAEMHWKLDYLFQTGFGKEIPENLLVFLESQGIRARGWLFEKQMRFTEWLFQDGSPVYALGTAQSDDVPAMAAYQDGLGRRLEELKQDPQWMKEADTNKDGTISPEEWKAAVARVESGVIDDMINKTPVDNAEGVRIARDEEGKPFIIAREKEQELINELYGTCVVCIWGGPVLSLALLGYLICRLRLFPVFK